MSSLTQAKRSAITDRLIDHFRAPRKQEMEARALELAKRIRAHILGDQLNLFMSLPDTWFVHTNHVSVFNDDDDDMNLSADYADSMRLPETIRVPACMDARSGALMPKLPEDIMKDYERLCEAAVALEFEARQLRSEVRLTLGRFSRIDKLVEAWPAVEPFIDRAPRIPASLPAVKLDGLTQRLGLLQPPVLVVNSLADGDLSD